MSGLLTQTCPGTMGCDVSLASRLDVRLCPAEAARTSTGPRALGRVRSGGSGSAVHEGGPSPQAGWEPERAGGGGPGAIPAVGWTCVLRTERRGCRQWSAARLARLPGAVLVNANMIGPDLSGLTGAPEGDRTHAVGPPPARSDHAADPSCAFDSTSIIGARGAHRVGPSRSAPGSGSGSGPKLSRNALPVADGFAALGQALAGPGQVGSRLGFSFGDDGVELVEGLAELLPEPGKPHPQDVRRIP